MPPKATRKRSDKNKEISEPQPKAAKLSKRNNMDDILDAVKSLAAKVDKLEKKVETKHEESSPAQCTKDIDITLDDLRQMTPLAQRADAILGMLP